MDEELRRLEQQVTRGEEGAKLPLARALERAGRISDALELVAGTPAWCGLFGDAGKSRFMDVEPIRKAPRVLWRSGEPRVWGGRPEIASELGVFVHDGDALAALDPETGHYRF